ncbi:putative tail fiber assembly protein [Escherichia phage vB_EcoM_IME392]|nr:putative tail fiber assembly protein [Escherichia phage vB_EcoM_IME392]
MSIEFNDQGFATTSGKVMVYNYNEDTREFTFNREEFIYVGVSVPAHSTIVPVPAEREGYARVYHEDTKKWEYVEDHRGVEVYSKADQTKVTIQELGPIDDIYTTIAPTSIHDNWDEDTGAWVLDEVAEHEAKVVAADAKKVTLIEDANAYINSKQWPSKLAMGRLSDADKVKFNLWLDYQEEVEAIETTDPDTIVWPEAPAK